jgi:hypothetical protein
VRRWELVVKPRTWGTPDAHPRTRHWTRFGAKARAKVLRANGLDAQFDLILVDRLTGMAAQI